jgi:hypothetical protein
MLHHLQHRPRLGAIWETMSGDLEPELEATLNEMELIEGQCEEPPSQSRSPSKPVRLATSLADPPCATGDRAEDGKSTRNARGTQHRQSKIFRILIFQRPVATQKASILAFAGGCD